MHFNRRQKLFDCSYIEQFIQGIHGSHHIHQSVHGSQHIHHIHHSIHGDVQPQPHACQSDDNHHIHHIHLSIHHSNHGASISTISTIVSTEMSSLSLTLAKVTIT